jgi:uncharacterized protein (DUF58 family)
MTNHSTWLTKGEQAGQRYVFGAMQQRQWGRSGSILGKRAGSSMDFREHREYQPGDDLRRLDWGAYARSDKLILKVYQEEIHPTLDILVDGSRSMALEHSAKEEATLGAAALLAAAGIRSGYSHRVWWAQEGCHPLPNGTAPPSLWQGTRFDLVTNPQDALHFAPPRWPSQGLRVVVSDLLWQGDPLTFLTMLGQQASLVVVVQVLARQDVEPPTSGLLRLVDSETGEEQEVQMNADSARRYKEAFARHQEYWRLAARQTGTHLTTLVAEDFVQDWRLDELVATEVLQVR